jgi:putative aldouronate transport system permease protein
MGTHINFLANPSTFRPEIILQQIWKETGWGTIIYLAALSGIDPQLYEAAEIDGAGRWKKMWHVTLPGIRGTVATLFILGMGSFLNMGFEQFLLMLNPLNRSVGDIYDTFVYEVGINQGKLSYTTAVGLFKSVASLILVAISNKVVKVLGEEGLY